ncbi:MAG: DUF935 domain-containing protein [Polyangiaceae bacterium]|jgi:hypothetical protein|nr:DUF935 domain-containing protein [Polyangiaceae bacterium]
MAQTAIKLASDGSEWVRSFDPHALQELIFGAGVPESEQFRRYYGRSVNPGVIEQVIRAADLGFMRDLTDLEYETVRIDGHLGAVIGKRFRRILAADYDVVPASGEGIDPVRAERRAQEVREQLASIPNLRRAFLRLAWGHFHGRASLELEWAYEPRAKLRWRVKSLNWIHPRRLSFGPERELRVRDDLFWSGGFERRGFDLREIPWKWIQFTPQLFNDYPEREGFGPHCLRITNASLCESRSAPSRTDASRFWAHHGPAA